MSKKFLNLGALGLSIFLLVLTLSQLYFLKYSNSDSFRLVKVLSNYDVNYNYGMARGYYNSEDYESAGVYFANSLNSNPLFTKSFVD
ncbi:MAG: hypothetical protein ACR2NW_04315, partial [Thermodesulfobacteriota bacterium]